jgi:hypothetical protein
MGTIISLLRKNICKRRMQKQIASFFSYSISEKTLCENGIMILLRLRFSDSLPYSFIDCLKNVIMLNFFLAKIFFKNGKVATCYSIKLKPSYKF